MATESPRVEFALGSEVSPGHFFKSSFARSFVSASSRDSTKSLDYDFYENGTIAEEPVDVAPDNANNNFYSLVNFAPDVGQPNPSSWRPGQPSPANGEASATELNELEKLRKQCQALTEENERLQASLRSQQAQVQVIDNVYLQSQVDTLQWQLKQSEANRQMYRSLMEQVVRFLERARKSLDIIHEKSLGKSATKDKSRVPRSRSVHAVQADHGGSPSSSCASSTTSSTSSASSTSSSSSRFGRAKSVAQIPANCSGPVTVSAATSLRDFTWSVLRRNEPAHSASPRTKPLPPQLAHASASVQDVNKAHESIAYRRPRQSEIDPDDVPPEKLAQEAFRLMRTVQSLLVMREPDLARLSASQEAVASACILDQGPDISSLSLQSSFANSTTLQETPMAVCASGDRANDVNYCCTTDDEVGRGAFGSGKVSNGSSTSAHLLNPGTRQSIDAASLNSTSSKNTEDEDGNSNSNSLSSNSCYREHINVSTPTSTPHNRKVKKSDRKEMHLKALRDWALGNSGGSVTSRPKPATSVSSAEDESGFSSMSSFQEVGLPQVANLSPIKGGCHTEVGLPEVPLEKIRHRRWSSTPAEFQALFKRHSGSFASGGQTTAESLSVWV
ncbi:PREDICTED: LOW QUALITY PROTEIN: uncharacterized protein DDB_G0271670 [Ceratosolen solmsi marchali]|uniref:LOW QUALITY PROTEIN: uncharacterized protein DDB_G0271670 n=1 Tax=Ceratosolen solmsi marchali TaxID=326594 RepID=A0AAJ6YCF0_9HYME|nr:PREDICTED: LOW QUALITY PROTEIN: uncharacterized protein DDB_G0271670 [Ceratosolen solmsi marchali]